MRRKNMSKGFTLIELLVVIAVIGLLSSIVLTSLASAKARANDASIISMARQVKTVLELHRNENPNYAGLLNTWNNNCAQVYTGNYAAKMRELCLGIIALENSPSTDNFYVGTPNSGNTNSYTILIRLPYRSSVSGAPRYLCLGANGGYSPDVSYGPWSESGCWLDPTNQ